MSTESVFYATLEEAIDAAREEFLADNPDSDEETANIEQFNMQKYILQMAISPRWAEFFASEDEEGECLAMLSGEAAQSVFDGDYDEIELRQNGWKKIRYTNGMKASFSWSLPWIPKRGRPQPMSGTSVNYS